MCIISCFLNACSIVLFYLWIQLWWERCYEVVWMEPWKCLLGVLKVIEFLEFGVQTGAVCSTGNLDEKVEEFQPQNGRSNSAFGLCSAWASKILDWHSHIVTVQLKYSQIEEVRSHPIDFNIRTHWQSDLTPLLVEWQAEFLPPVSLHKWCGSRLLVLIMSANLLIDASLLMWLFFLIAMVMCQDH